MEGMDDIISLGLETMEVQTVRMVAPQHFEQYWQAGTSKQGRVRDEHPRSLLLELLGDDSKKPKFGKGRSSTASSEDNQR